MPTYVAFLRAINLGPTRKFPKADIVAAVEAAGGEDVLTHINTGNVRLTTRMRSRARIEEALERAFAADRGFEVPTVVFTQAELRAVAADVEELGAGHDGRHYVSLLKNEPGPTARAAIEAAAAAGQRAVVRGRAAHLLIDSDYHSSTLTNATVEKHLGVSTNRAANVVTTVAAKWGA